MADITELTLVIPAYNEAPRLSATLHEMIRFLSGRPEVPDSEIVVVDDGSSDDTAGVARSILGDFPGRVVSYSPNRGKGAAVRAGMLAARGRIRLFSDADLSTPLDEIPKFLAAHARGYDVVIGSRKRHGARVEIRQPWLRESMGKVFTALSNVLVVSGVSDFTCGFKSLTNRASETIFSQMKLEDWSFDAELLYRVRREGYRLAEVPVTWRDDSRTRVNRLRDTIGSLRGILRIALLRGGIDVGGEQGGRAP